MMPTHLEKEIAEATKDIKLTGSKLEKQKQIASIRKNDCYVRASDKYNTKIRKAKTQKNKAEAERLYKEREKLLHNSTTSSRQKTSASDIASTTTIPSSQKTTTSTSHQKTSESIQKTKLKVKPKPSTIANSKNNSTIEPEAEPETEKLSHDSTTPNIEKLSHDSTTPDIEKLSQALPDELPDNVVVVKPDEQDKPLPPILLARPSIKKENLSPMSIYYVSAYSGASLTEVAPDLERLSRGEISDLSIAQIISLDLFFQIFYGNPQEKAQSKRIYWDIQKQILREQKKNNTPASTPVKGSILDEIMSKMPSAEIVDNPAKTEKAPDPEQNA